MKCRLPTPLILLFSGMLSSCTPYVGRDYENENLCLGMDVAMLSYGDGDCKHMSQRRQKDMPKDAPENSKRVIYTEEQRLAMANDAARRLYPHATFWMAKQPAWKAVALVGGRQYHSCNHMLATRALAARVSKQLPDDLLFQKVAQHWSQRYSDSQIAQIQRASYTTDLAGLDKTKSHSIILTPQWPIVGKNPMVVAKGMTEHMETYWTERQALLQAMAKEEIMKAEASHQFAPAALCRIGSSPDPVTGDYGIVIDRWAMEPRSKK